MPVSLSATGGRQVSLVIILLFVIFFVVRLLHVGVFIVIVVIRADFNVSILVYFNLKVVVVCCGLERLGHYA